MCPKLEKTAINDISQEDRKIDGNFVHVQLFDYITYQVWNYEVSLFKFECELSLDVKTPRILYTILILKLPTQSYHGTFWGQKRVLYRHFFPHVLQVKE